MKESTDSNVIATTNFLLDEVEPWYLDLQNQDFGSQARPDYNYYGKYRARNVITVGTNVTPKTDIGPSTIAPNAYLVLRAGDDIILEDGFETEFGARFDGLSGSNAYELCDNSKIASEDDATTSNENYFAEFIGERNNSTADIEKESLKNSNPLDIKIYPNPNQNKFTITSGTSMGINQCIIYDLMGKVVYQQDFSNTSTYQIQHELPQGTYFVKVGSVEGLFFTKKLIVL